MNKNNFPTLFSFEKLTNDGQTSIKHIMQRLAEYNNIYENMRNCKDENTKLLKRLELSEQKRLKAVEYINNHKTQKASYSLYLDDYEIDELLEILRGDD